MPTIEKILVLDFETHYDTASGYTLKRMTNEEYLRDPRFLCFGAAYHWLGDNEVGPVWLPHATLKSFLEGLDWDRIGVIAHNSMFDVSILRWHYGHLPGFIFDTLSMARAKRGEHGGNSLAKLAAYYGLPDKGTALHKTDGLRVLPFEVHKELAEYCKHDVFLCEEIFKRLSVGYPKKEMRVIDATLRMAVDPQLELDAEILEKAIDEEERNRSNLLQRVNCTDADLASNEKFAEVLRAFGVEPPTKKSKTTGLEAYAFAKNDAEFQALMGCGNEDVELLCEARLRVKSTLERTRAQRFLDISKRGKLPVPLHYYGGHTGRWSAARGANINLQNLKRGSFLRQAIMAPEGYTLCVADLSQIEVRVLAHLAGNTPLLDVFRSGEDVYAVFGRQMFGIPDLTQETHPVLRQSAKSGLLGCGFQLGFVSFAAQLLTGFLGAPPTRYDANAARQMGVSANDLRELVSNETLLARVLAIPRVCSDEEVVVHAAAAKRIVDKYRQASPAVTQFWKLMGSLIQRSLVDGEVVKVGCLEFRKGEIELPNKMVLRYPEIECTADDFGRPQYSYFNGKKRKKLYAGSITENVVQAVARIVMSDAMLRIMEKYKVLMTVHDELVVLVPTGEAEFAQGWIHNQMVAEPWYLPGIPLAAKVDCAQRYGDAK